MERWQKPEGETARGGTADHPSRSSLDYNTPLRSVRGNAVSAPSPYYKLSAELSRESLRVPGAVPFMWEQSPGRRKFTSASTPSNVSPHGIIVKPQAGSNVVPENTSASVVNPAKPNLATLFRQPSLEGVVEGIPAADDSWPDPPLSSSIPQILPPPAADRPRSSSARYSVIQHNMSLGSSFNHAALRRDNGDDDEDTVSEEAISDALTCTAGEGLSMDDSLVPSGTLRPASTPSEARDFIMHRFLPAAHTIACELPQTPSRRFLPPVGIAAPCSPATPARCNGNFGDYAAVSRPSPLRYASASSTPASNARRVQHRAELQTESFHGEEQEEDEEEDVDEEPPSTPKACGIFPFRITLTFHGGSSRRSLPAKHQHNVKQQHQKKGIKSMNCVGGPMRIMDILHDDQLSSHDDESPAHRLRSKQSDAERERTKLAVLEQAGLMRGFNDRRLKPLADSYHRSRPNLHQLLTAQKGASEFYNEEASEYGSYQDAPSRLQSPSPAACYPNARALRAYNNMQAPLVSSMAQRSRSFAGLNGAMNTSGAVINTTEQHLLNSSFYYYNMHTSINKPHYQAQLASPSTYHTSVSSHVDASHQRCAYHDSISNDNSSKGSCHEIQAIEKDNYTDTTSNADQWDASNNHLAPNTHIINNALFEHEDQEANMSANTNCPSNFKTISEHEATYNSPNCLNKDSSFNQGGPGREHVYGEICNINDDHHASKGDQYVSRGNQCLYKGSKGNVYSTNVNHHMINGDLHGGQRDHHIVSNGNHYVTNHSHQGDHYVINDHHYASKGDPHYLINGDNHMSKGAQYVSNGNNNNLSNGDIYASNGNVNGKLNSSFLSKSLLSPPLPKSPTHSWLDRTMPLVACTNKSLGTSSRLSHMHKATTPGDDYAAHVSASKTKRQGHLGSTEAASKWEALVKGSHLQPGHLRFSEELLHQSHSVMKVGAS